MEKTRVYDSFARRVFLHLRFPLGKIKHTQYVQTSLHGFEASENDVHFCQARTPRRYQTNPASRHGPRDHPVAVAPWLGRDGRHDVAPAGDGKLRGFKWMDSIESSEVKGTYLGIYNPWPYT